MEFLNNSILIKQTFIKSGEFLEIKLGRIRVADHALLALVN